MVNELVGSIKQALPVSTLASAKKEAVPESGRAQSPAAVETSSSEPISKEDMNAAVKKMQDYLQSMDRDLLFSVDEDSGITVVKVVDPSTEEVVRQIPSEEVMRVVRSLESGGGLLSDLEA